jgi:hypothetical protein
MKAKDFYMAMCVVGIVVPYYVMWRFLEVMGTDYNLMMEWLFVNWWNTFFLADLFLVAVAIIGYIVIEGRRLGLPRLWLPLVCVGLVGVCLALPLFLYMREVHLERAAAR